MKKIAAVIAMTVVAASANAGTATITGNLGSWKSWNAASKAPIPYFVTAAGLNLVQANNFGDNIQTNPGALNIAVVGTSTFDDVTGAVLSMSLSQVGSYTGWYDTDSDLLADDSLTITGLQWTYAGGFLSQTAGTFSGCTSSSPVCAFTVSAGNTNDHGNGLGQSVFDFQGINAGFLTQPRRNATGTGYGTVSYKVWAATAGAGAIASLATAPAAISNRTLDVSSRVNSGTTTTNAANTAQLSLQFTNAVPVPAAAWLMGSGLVGLAGIARRRKMA